LTGLIQESVGADVRRLCFVGILKVSLLTSAPTLPRYLESALDICLAIVFELEIWSFSGVWGLVFGASQRLPETWGSHRHGLRPAVSDDLLYLRYPRSY